MSSCLLRLVGKLAAHNGVKSKVDGNGNVTDVGSIVCHAGCILSLIPHVNINNVFDLFYKVLNNGGIIVAISGNFGTNVVFGFASDGGIRCSCAGNGGIDVSLVAGRNENSQRGVDGRGLGSVYGDNGANVTKVGCAVTILTSRLKRHAGLQIVVASFILSKLGISAG